MKKILPLFFLTLILSGALLPALASAEIGLAARPALVDPQNQGSTGLTDQTNINAAGGVAGNGGGSVTARLLGEGGELAVDTIGSCLGAFLTFGQVWTVTDCLANSAHAVVYLIALLANFVLYLVGVLLTFTVQHTVVNMGHYITSSSAEGVRVAWTVIRDIANIAIIGGLVATAIGSILKMPNVNAQRFIVRLIIAALLVNFSFFFAGAIIDSSNFLATKIYEATVGSNGNIIDRFSQITVSLRPDFSTWITHNSITAPFNYSYRAQGASAAVIGLINAVGLLIMTCVSVFVFLSVIALLVGRFVALILILISSPIGIAGLAIPKFETYAKQWWQALFEQAFFAPIYFLLLGLSLTILSNLSGTQVAFADAGGGFSAMGQILTFIVAIIFMLMALRVAKNLSARSKYLTDVYKSAGKFTDTVLNPVRFGGALIARNTLGRGAERFGYRFDDWVAKNSEKRWMKPLLALGVDQYAKAGLDKLADKKFGGYTDSQGKKVEGFKGYETKKKEREAREVHLDELRKKGERDKELNALRAEDDKKQKELEDEQAEGDKRKLLARKGDINPRTGKPFLRDRWETAKEFWERQNLRDNKIRDPLTGKLETDEETAKRIREKGVTIMVKDKLTGIERRETNDELKERLANGLGLKKDEKGGLWGYYERLERTLGTREVRGDAQGIVDVFSMDDIKRDYRKNPKNLLKYAHLLSWDQFKAVQNDPSVRHDIKDQMWGKRSKTFVDMIRAVQDDVENGRLIEGSDEYNARVLVPYNWMGKYMPHDEFKALMKADHIGTGPGALSGKDLRKMKAFWLGSLSTTAVQIKNEKLLSTTEQRATGSLKRSPFTDARDEYSLALLALGFEGNAAFLPEVGGTVDYSSTKRAGDRAKGILDSTNPLIDLYEKYQREDNDGERSGISTQTYELAKRQKRFVEMALQGADGFILPDGRKLSDIKPANNTREARKKADLERMRVLKVAKDKYNEEIRKLNDPTDLAARERIIAQDPLYVLFDKMRQVEGGYNPNRDESGTPGWHGGKNEFEARGLLGKREDHTISNAFGIRSGKRLQALLEGSDDSEKIALWENILMHGDDKLIQNAITNPNIQDQIQWPNPGRLKEINEVRQEWYGKNALPENPFPRGGGDDNDGGDDGSGGGNDRGDGGGGGNNPGGGMTFAATGSYTPPPRYRVTYNTAPPPTPPSPPPPPDLGVGARTARPGGTPPPEEIIDAEFSEVDGNSLPTTSGPIGTPGGQGDVEAPVLQGTRSSEYLASQRPTSVPPPTTTAPATEPQVTPEEYFGQFDTANPYSDPQIERARAFVDTYSDDQITRLPTRVITLALPGVKRASTVNALLDRYKGDPGMTNTIRGGFRRLRALGKLNGDVSRVVDSWDQEPT
jgi:hypothetical protein